MKKTTNQTFETYNHRILWEAADKNLQLATSSSNDRKYFALGGMFLFFAAFEGYLNWLGTRIAPEVWEDERQFFSRAPYQGTIGKYRFLAKILNLPVADASKGPFQTLKKLRKLRDMVAHPKPEAGTRSVKVKEGHFPPHHQGNLAKNISPNAASEAKDHLKKLAEQLHSEAKRLYPDSVRESEAFGSMLGYETTNA